MTETNGVKGNHAEKPDYDLIVVGAGFGGIRVMHELQEMGLKYKVIEAGTGVGGTWYWNRYPGARTDTESWVYILNFSKELNTEWTWKERFPRQPEVLQYLNFVVDKFDMKKDIQFSTKVQSCHYEKSTNIWTLTTEEGERFTCKYFIPASGVLSVGRQLPFKGADNFKGESYKTFAWPKEQVSYKGKRVAVIGTGATAVQIIPQVAYQAKELTVFQRTPNYVLPARNHPLTEEQSNAIKESYDEVWQQARSQSFGMHMTDSKQTMKDMKSKEQHRRVLEYGWEVGGFRFIFETFGDLIVSQESNDVASDFVREKIRTTVKDEETAEKLVPDYPIFAKRPPLGHSYFETFNRPHVKLVSVRENGIDEITEKGVRLEDGEEYEFDVIIYAIGFDASTGALATMDVRANEDMTLGEHWSQQLETFLGICVEHYPNMFMISGPQSPFANLPVVIDGAVDWIARAISYMEKNGYSSCEPTHEAQEQYCKQLNDVYEATVLPKAARQAGANIPGKNISPLFWFGGVGPYFELCNKEVDNNWPGLKML
ncbi:uncharacterized protein LTR77_006685 [Saxophila tyrrhenica]|uniref:Cyclohexanone monooxygenase n=1 Tax=Saxophila tyrrhenica TaxID=1690608 RepID=A0AAV9P7I7_9PEZI|nr:hypothetical protein LTR77_006685 [Saxophila tyrrhenica]